MIYDCEAISYQWCLEDGPGLVGHYPPNIWEPGLLQVTEEGSEAAAATAVIMMMRSMPSSPLPAHFDRPFLFFIKDQETGLVLFQGRVVNPNQWFN